MIKNNNPGNIRCNPANNWKGQTGCSSNGFVIFSELYYGIRAMMKIIINDILAGKNTITKIVTEYAPPFENNTAAYIVNVAVWSGIGVNEIINSAEQLIPVIKAMIRMETSDSVPDVLCLTAYNELLNGVPSDESNPDEPGTLFTLLKIYSVYKLLS